MKILFTCNEYPPYPHGGLGTFVKEIAEKLIHSRHKVFVYGIYLNVKNRTVENINGVTIIRDPFIETKQKIRPFRQIKVYGKNIDELCEKYKINIVEAHDTGGFFMFIKFPKLFVRLHNGERYFKRRGIVTNFIERTAFAYRKSTIIGVSDFIISKFKNHFKIIHPKSKISRIYNGINVNLERNNYPKNKTILYAGTIKPIKGVNNLIEAFYESEVYNKGYTLEIYGNDTKHNGKSYINQLLTVDNNIIKLVKEKKINYNGAIPKNQLLKEYSKADICIFPSIAESFGLVVIEAMNNGAIVIYTNQGAANEIVKDGEDAFLVSPNNSEELSKKILDVINLDDFIKDRIRLNAISKSTEFSMDKCVEDTLNLYKNET